MGIFMCPDAKFCIGLTQIIISVHNTEQRFVKTMFFLNSYSPDCIVSPDLMLF